MANPPYENKWKQYHIYLPVEEARALKDKVCTVLGCVSSSFYRKLSFPEHLSIAEKKAIAEVYKLPTTFLFPELQNETA